MAKNETKTPKKESVKKEVKKQNSNKKPQETKKVIKENKVTKKETKDVEITKPTKTIEKKKDNEKLMKVIKKVDDNRISILFGVVGFLLATLLFRCILWPDRIATLSDGTQPVASVNNKNITADDLYDSMKEYFSANVFLNDIDNMILSEMYPETDEMNEEINDTAEYYYQAYESYYGYTKEEFLSQAGYSKEADFIESLKLDYRRNQYYEEYAKSLVTDKEIEKYYDSNVYGDIDSKHILVKIDTSSDDGLTDEEAKELATEIISKLDSGKTWDEVIEEYKAQIVNEELGYNAFNASLESTYLEECKNLEVGKYSKTPVLTSYGYHIVYKIDQKEKPTLEDVKDDIIEELATEKKNDDSNLYYKSLIKMREDAKLEFFDTKLEEEYQKIVNSYK